VLLATTQAEELLLAAGLLKMPLILIDIFNFHAQEQGTQRAQGQGCPH
jgi:hypothetical protein